MEKQNNQGEPVALPNEESMREAYHRCRYHAPHIFYAGWNACLDEIAKLGPLYTHSNASDADDLLAATSLQFAGRLDAVEKERDTLRAQLAERDTLLNLADHALSANSFNSVGDVIEHDQVMRDEVCAKIAALYASAEPSEPVKRDGWVPVIERKPEYDKAVLVAFDTHAGKSYTTAHLTNQKRCSDPRSTEHDEIWYVHVSGGHQLKTVTHWCEIDSAALERKL